MGEEGDPIGKGPWPTDPCESVVLGTLAGFIFGFESVIDGDSSHVATDELISARLPLPGIVLF